MSPSWHPIHSPDRNPDPGFDPDCGYDPGPHCEYNLTLILKLTMTVPYCDRTLAPDPDFDYDQPLLSPCLWPPILTVTMTIPY